MISGLLYSTRYTRNCGTNPSPHSTLLYVVPCSDLQVLEKALEVSSGSRVWWKFAARLYWDQFDHALNNAFKCV